MEPVKNDRHPRLKLGKRTILGDLLAMPLSSRRTRSIHSGSRIIGPLAALDGEYVCFRYRANLYKCHVDDFVEHSRINVFYEDRTNKSLAATSVKH